MLEVDLHIGAHRIFGQVLNATYDVLKTDIDSSLRFMGEGYKDFIIPAMDGLRLISDPVERDAQKDIIQDQIDANRLIISKASLLCKDEHVYSRAGLYSSIDDRLTQLVDMFSGCDISIHFCITNMFDFLRSMRGVSQRRLDNAISWEGAENLLWCTTVLKIRNSVPSVPLYVWDCESGSRAALEFGAHIFDIRLDDLTRKFGRRGLKKLHAGLDLGLSGAESLKIPDGYEELLDAMYDVDLNTIARMDGVTLIS